MASPNTHPSQSHEVFENDASAPAARLCLWYRRPAPSWLHALPIGNGSVGAMVFGEVENERIQLNEKSLWSGGPQDADNPDALSALPEVRRLLFEEKYGDAEKLAAKKMLCRGQGSARARGAMLPYGSYQTLGDLTLAMRHGDGTTPLHVLRYLRWLDLGEAIAHTSYTINGVNYSREVFVSYPDRVLVARIAADRPGQINLCVQLTRPERFTTEVVGANELLMSGQLTNGTDGNGMKYAARLRAIPTGGKLRAEGDSLIIEAADNITILLAAATDHIPTPPYRGKDYKEAIDAAINPAAKASFETLRKSHIEDHQRNFRRVQFWLGEQPARPTDERIADLENHPSDPALAALLYNYGRYLLIASSREGALPANLQGIWGDGIQLPWNCDYHTNANLNMNYWPVETANLLECFSPLHELIENMVEPGTKTAHTHYGTRGWTVHTIHNAWGYSSPGEGLGWGLFPLAGPWMCQHLWEHYAFGGDREYLRKAWPILKASAEFALDFLVTDPKRNKLVIAPSTSPENSFKIGDEKHSLCVGSTIDLQITWDLVMNCIAAMRALTINADFENKLIAALAKLQPMQVGKAGHLQEWIEDFEETDPHHRHVSHLFGLFPGFQISPHRTPELIKAARVTLDRRGDEGTGWSCAWKACWWARLGDGDRAWKLILNQLRPTGESSTTYTKGGGSYPNLFCAHPPFQIDGNFGVVAAITEMLVQSHENQITLLPALPSAWKDGHVTGIRARGGFEIDVEWKDGALAAATVRSTWGTDCHAAYQQRTVHRMMKPGETFQLEPGAFPS